MSRALVTEGERQRCESHRPDLSRWVLLYGEQLCGAIHQRAWLLQFTRRFSHSSLHAPSGSHCLVHHVLHAHWLKNVEALRGGGRGVARQETCPFALLRAVGRRKKFQFFFVSNGGLVVLVETALKAWAEAFNKADLPSKLGGWEIIPMHFLSFFFLLARFPRARKR